VALVEKKSHKAHKEKLRVLSALVGNTKSHKAHKEKLRVLSALVGK
jgi:hypothetical protein